MNPFLAKQKGAPQQAGQMTGTFGKAKAGVRIALELCLKRGATLLVPTVFLCRAKGPTVVQVRRNSVIG